MSRCWDEPRPCVICTASFVPKNGKQRTCGKPECRKARNEQRAAARKRGEFIEGPRARGAVVLAGADAGVGELGPAVRAVVSRLERRHAPVTLTLKGLGVLVRNTVHGLRSKDRELYEEALCELAAWPLLNLARVRASAEDRA